MHTWFSSLGFGLRIFALLNFWYRRNRNANFSHHSFYFDGSCTVYTKIIALRFHQLLQSIAGRQKKNITSAYRLVQMAASKWNNFILLPSQRKECKWKHHIFRTKLLFITALLSGTKKQKIVLITKFGTGCFFQFMPSLKWREMIFKDTMHKIARDKVYFQMATLHELY